MFRRKPPPQRKPHPDPRVEARLQQVISLRRAAARNEEMLDEARENIARINAWLTAHPHWDGGKERRTQLARMQGEMAELNAATARMHEEIGKMLDEFGPDALLWLEVPDAR